jgi:hypothetical protein
VVDAAHCCSGDGGSTQLRPDQCGCGVIGVAAGSGGGSRTNMAAAWIWRRGGRPMRERRPSTTRRQRGRRRRWEWSQCRWRSDGELRSADGLKRRSDGWINRIGYLTKGAALGGVEINLPGGGAGEGSGRLRGSEPNLMPCRKNRLGMIVGCIVLCLSPDIYRVQES